MPLGLCDDCDRLYVLDLDRRPHQSCHHCSQPVRVVSREETLAIARSQREGKNSPVVPLKPRTDRAPF
jgi:hydrogenase maturation factor HypF (carbamoyltransferase family)